MVMSISIDNAESYAPANKPLSLLSQSYAPIRNNQHRNSIQREINLEKIHLEYNSIASRVIFPAEHTPLTSSAILMQYVYSILNGNLKPFMSLALLELKCIKDPFPFHKAFQAKISSLKREGKLYTNG